MYKKLLAIISTFALVLMLGVGTVSAAIRTVTLRVTGMTCGGCATSVEKALKSTEGVASVRVSFERGRAVIKYDDQKVTEAKLREVINGTGFTAVEEKTE
jgi:copper chaperone CopZ